MKKIGIGLLATGILIVVFSMSMDTTVETDSYDDHLMDFERVHNIGLMQKQQNFLLVGLALAVTGTALLIINALSNSTVSDQRHSDTRVCPYCAEEIKARAKKCRYCGQEVEPDVESVSAPTESQASMEDRNDFFNQIFSAKIREKVHAHWDRKVVFKYFENIEGLKERLLVLLFIFATGLVSLFCIFYYTSLDDFGYDLPQALLLTSFVAVLLYIYSISRRHAAVTIKTLLYFNIIAIFIFILPAVIALTPSFWNASRVLFIFYQFLASIISYYWIINYKVHEEN